MKCASRLISAAAVVGVAIAVNLASLPAASASSLTLDLVNNTGLRFTAVTYLGGPTPEYCSGSTSGVFRETVPFGHMSWIGQGSSGTLSLNCSGPGIAVSEFGYLPNFLPDFSLSGGSLGFTMAGGYIPGFGSYVQCFAGNPSTAEAWGLTPMSDYVLVSVDGSACTVDYLPGVTSIGSQQAASVTRAAARMRNHLHTRLISNVAHVEDGKVRLPLQIQGRESAVSKIEKVRERIKLTTADGRVVASGTRTVPVGEPTTVTLRLRKAFVAAPSEANSLAVTARITRADLTGGTGHDVESLTLNYGEAFPLPHAAVGGNYVPF